MLQQVKTWNETIKPMIRKRDDGVMTLGELEYMRFKPEAHQIIEVITVTCYGGTQHSYAFRKVVDGSVFKLTEIELTQEPPQ